MDTMVALFIFKNLLKHPRRNMEIKLIQCLFLGGGDYVHICALEMVLVIVHL